MHLCLGCIFCGHSGVCVQPWTCEACQVGERAFLSLLWLCCPREQMLKGVCVAVSKVGFPCLLLFGHAKQALPTFVVRQRQGNFGHVGQRNLPALAHHTVIDKGPVGTLVFQVSHKAARRSRFLGRRANFAQLPSTGGRAGDPHPKGQPPQASAPSGAYSEDAEMPFAVLPVGFAPGQIQPGKAVVAAGVAAKPVLVLQAD